MDMTITVRLPSTLETMIGTHMYRYDHYLYISFNTSQQTVTEHTEDLINEY